MNLSFNPDQQALLDALDRIAQHHESRAVLGGAPFEASAELQRDLEDAGVFEAAAIDELGPVAATALVLRLARLPQCVELPAAALVLPLLAPELPRPCAVLWDRRDRPARWLPGARTVLCVRGDTVEALDSRLRGNDGEPDRHAREGGHPVLPLTTPYGYPIGRLSNPDALPWQPLNIDATELRRLWRIGVAAELAGSLDAALQAVVTHVRDRRQFGRPLGAFQAIQHRLAQAAVRVEGARWLALQAAHTGRDGDALAAAGYAQQAAEGVVYDLHQFMGAMGLTLEHPLHRYTTRAKRLRAELGGAQAQHLALADAAWGPRTHLKEAA